ncbi:hypothetical protein [uncultured Flavobacterium sp.]|mgnify:CR=1 FL=1|uniref:hypothetical protein n=1 Tax=uncultured Flavobacterium sp. TaxID=165435 RepID=UPI0030ED754D|tara:strand:+ start:21760 stop:22374 length:615 start_codon:yes stop_codon:yes gene_type:complete
MKKFIYYQPIIKPLAKNGSERLGVNLITKIWDAEKPELKMELTIYAKSTEKVLEKLEIQLIGENKFETEELPCEYYLCSEEVVKQFKPFEVSKPFKSGYEWDNHSNYYVAWLHFPEVEKHYKEVIEPHNQGLIGGSEIDFMAYECIPGTMDVSKITFKGCKTNFLFCEIENKISITKDRNRAMTIQNLAQKFGCNPIEFINKIV